MVRALFFMGVFCCGRGCGIGWLPCQHLHFPPPAPPFCWLYSITHDRYDKSLNIFGMPNGRLGMNVEHSWADALVVAHLWEVSAMTNERDEYGPDGHCKRPADSGPAGTSTTNSNWKQPSPALIKWDISDGPFVSLVPGLWWFWFFLFFVFFFFQRERERVGILGFVRRRNEPRTK